MICKNEYFYFYDSEMECGMIKFILLGRAPNNMLNFRILTRKLPAKNYKNTKISSDSLK
jgi:hypothetical protein